MSMCSSRGKLVKPLISRGAAERLDGDGGGDILLIVAANARLMRFDSLTIIDCTPQ